LKELVDEKNNLIEKYHTKLDDVAEENAQLHKDLAIEQGHESPWRIWSSIREKSPNAMLIRDFDEHSASLLSAILKNPSTSEVDRVRALLSLAMFAQTQNKNLEAAKYLSDAIAALRKLRSADPDDQAIGDALAQAIDDYSKIAALEPSKQNELLDESRAIRKRLAEAQPSDIARQVSWFDAEMRAAVSAGVKQRQERLKAAQAIQEQLTSAWPSDIAATYRLLSFLAEKDSLLASMSESAPPAAAHKD